MAHLPYSGELASVGSQLMSDSDTGVVVMAARSALLTHDERWLARVVEAYRDGEEEVSFHIAVEISSLQPWVETAPAVWALKREPGLSEAIDDLFAQTSWDGQRYEDPEPPGRSAP
jgi:hypothetical protein